VLWCGLLLLLLLLLLLCGRCWSSCRVKGRLQSMPPVF
jgi:hypothetical protein